MITDAEKAAGFCDPFRYIPPFPGETGWHWICRFENSGLAIPLWWNAVWHKNGG